MIVRYFSDNNDDYLELDNSDGNDQEGDYVYEEYDGDENGDRDGEEPSCDKYSNGPQWEVHYCAPYLKFLPKCCKFGEVINIRSRSCNGITNFTASEITFKGEYLNNVSVDFYHFKHFTNNYR